MLAGVVSSTIRTVIGSQFNREKIVHRASLSDLRPFLHV